MGKLYHCDYREFGVEIPKRVRENITRSIGALENTKGFSGKNNQAAVDLIKCTGLRRVEAEHIKAKDFYEKDGKIERGAFCNIANDSTIYCETDDVSSLLSGGTDHYQPFHYNSSKTTVVVDSSKF